MQIKGKEIRRGYCDRKDVDVVVEVNYAATGEIKKDTGLSCSYVSDGNVCKEPKEYNCPYFERD